MRPVSRKAAERRLGRVFAFGIAAVILIAFVPGRVVAAEPAPGATVDDLLALVKGYNPELAAAALDSEEALAKVKPAGALDDPMINLQNDQGFRQTIYSVTQEFPLWGKRSLRQDIAAANAQSITFRAGTVRNDIAERVKVTFAQYYQAENAVHVTQTIQDLLRTVSGTARARYGQGLANQSDAIRAEFEQARLESEIASLVQAGETAQAKINALIGRHANEELATPIALRNVPSASTLNLDELVNRARAHNPMLAMSQADVTAAEGERGLVRKSWYPDLTITAGADDLPHQSPKPMVGVGIRVPLQWGVRDAQAQAATAKRGAAQLRLDAAGLQIESDLKSALATLRQTEQTGDLLAHTLTPQSEAAYRSALSSYQLGKGDLTSIWMPRGSSSKYGFSCCGTTRTRRPP